MTTPRCESCKHYSEPRHGWAPKGGLCHHPKLMRQQDEPIDDTLVPIDVFPDFGCILHQERPNATDPQPAEARQP